MADVFEVESPDSRRFALKVFRREKESPFLQARFIAEAKILKTIYHPRIVRVHEYGIDEATGKPWFVMDLVLNPDGTPSTLEAARRRGGIPDATLRKWFADAKEALNYLHQCGIVHRDVKLENILIGGDGHARLADFGVSRIVDGRLREEASVETTFVTGETTGTRPVMGTYFYLTPETRGGKAATPESDFYALGVAFFRLLTGMWYEPGANALDLLAPFPKFWCKELSRLLGGHEKASRSHVWRRYAILASAVLCVASATALFLSKTGFFVSAPAERTPTNSPASGSSWTLSRTFAVPRLQSLPLGKDGTAMEFCACPPGEFMMSNIGDDTTCHKVKITRPFWIGRTLVTARQLRQEFPDTERDRVARELESTFTNMYVACRLWGEPIRKYLQRLNLRYGILLPPGYEFRLPTEAELEYAIREGGARMPMTKDVWRDAAETKRLLASAGLEFREDLRLLPSKVVNAWGLATLWTDTEQSVLDMVDGRPGTKTATNSISYAAEETDPLRAGSLHLSRQFQFQRWMLMKEPSGFIRICIAPRLEPTAGRDGPVAPKTVLMKATNEESR